jgi:hypothetical protein
MRLGYVKQHATGFMHAKIQLPTSHTNRETVGSFKAANIIKCRNSIRTTILHFLYQGSYIAKKKMS